MWNQSEIGNSSDTGPLPPDFNSTFRIPFGVERGTSHGGLYDKNLEPMYHLELYLETIPDLPSTKETEVCNAGNEVVKDKIQLGEKSKQSLNEINDRLNYVWPVQNAPNADSECMDLGVDMTMVLKDDEREVYGICANEEKKGIAVLNNSPEPVPSSSFPLQITFENTVNCEFTKRFNASAIRSSHENFVKRLVLGRHRGWEDRGNPDSFHIGQHGVENCQGVPLLDIVKIDIRKGFE